MQPKLTASNFTKIKKTNNFKNLQNWNMVSGTVD